MLTSRVSTVFEQTCIIGGVHFDGATRIKNAALTADALDENILVSYWLKARRLGFGEHFTYALSQPAFGGSGEPQFILTADQFDQSLASQNSDAVTTYQNLSMNPPSSDPENVNNVGDPDEEWCHFLIQLNTAGNRPGAVLINGVNWTYAYRQSLGADMVNGLSGLPFWLGGDDIPPSFNFSTCDMAEFWLMSGVDLMEVDGTFAQTTVDKFLDPFCRPKFLGETGEGPTGTAATIYLHRCNNEDASVFLTNRGTGGDFVEETGALSASATDPPGPRPRPSGILTITGGTTIGSTLSVVGTWSNSATVTYEWFGNAGSVLATTPTYLIPPGSEGQYYWVIVLGTNADGSIFADTSKNLTDSGTFYGPIT